MDFQIEKYFEILQQQTADYGPKLIAALAIFAIAFVIGKLLAYAARHLIDNTELGADNDLGTTIGRALFWVTMLVATPAILGALGMDGLLKPMQDMSSKFLAFLPNLVGAGLIFGVGFMVAKVAKEALTGVLQAAQVDRLADRFGLNVLAETDEGKTRSGSKAGGKTSKTVAKTREGKRRVSARKAGDDDDAILDANISSMETNGTGIAGFIGTLAFTLLIIPVAIAALDTLGIASIAEPAKQMLQSVLDALPNIFAAAVVLGLAFLIGRFASTTLKQLLPATGIDKVGTNLGLSKEFTSATKLSTLAGGLAFAAIMIFGTIEAAKLLNFQIVSDLMTQILELGGRVLLGSAIIGFGVIVADFIADLVTKSKDAKSVAPFLRIAIIVLATAMGLRQMGLANEIINMGFTLLIGALALGSAIAIGWGGKDTAGRLLEKWTKNL